DHVQIRQGSLDVGLRDGTDLVEAAQLHPEALILQQVEKKLERRLVEAVLTPNARHVVDDGHRRERPDESLMFDEIRGVDMKNENPAESLQHGEMLAQVVHAAGPVLHQMKSRAAYPTLGQGLKRLGL